VTREELITHLVGCGFKAEPRDWAMGQTVRVYRTEMQVGTILAVPGCTYCWPVGSELAVLDPPGRELRFNTVGALVDYLTQHFAAAEEFWRTQESHVG
jgi:hypothetical protein